MLYVSDEKDAALFDGLDLGEIVITSGAKVSTGKPSDDAFHLPEVAGVAVTFHHAEGDKCARCWMVLPEVGSVTTHTDLCVRCADAVDALKGADA